MLIIAFMWFLVFLAGFPGFFTYDVDRESDFGQLYQIEHNTYNDHHPVIHTWFLYITLKIGIIWFNNFNFSVAFSITIQAIIVLLIILYCQKSLLNMEIGLIGYTVSVLYFALNPIVILFSFATTKDVLFSSFVLLYCFMIINFLRKENTKLKNDIPNIVILTLTCFLMLIFKLTSFFALMFFTLIIIMIVWHQSKAKAKTILLSNIIAFVLAVIWLFPISIFLGIEHKNINMQNALSVPGQQIASCLFDDNVSLDDKNYIKEITSMNDYQNNLWDVARSQLKKDIDYSQATKLYLYLMYKYPKTYIKAFLTQTEESYSIFSYIKNKYSKYDYETGVFAMYQYEPSYRDSKLPVLLNFIENISTKKEVNIIPFIGCLFKMSFYVITLFVCLFWSIINKNKISLCFIAPLFFILLLSILGPCMLLRYCLYLVYSVPYLCYFSFSNNFNNKIIDNV